MIKVELPLLIGRLNKYCRHAMEEASSLCISHYGNEVTIQHLIYKLIENPYSDVRLILNRAELDNEVLKQKLAQGFDENSEQTSQYPTFSPLLIELLQEAWILGSIESSEKEIRSGALLLAALMNTGRYLTLDVSRYLDDINRETLRKGFHEILMTSGESADEKKSSSTAAATGTDSPLDKYGTNFTQLAREGKIDPVLCRDEEIDLMIDILSRRRKNNPIAVGDAGVGKSAVVEGLALRVNEGKVPAHLNDIELWGLDMGSLQAGASVKGEFEKRLKSVIEQVKTSTTPIILFIDEAHTLIGAGGQAGGSDAANLLKPALARGELRTIAATTWSEYKKYFEKDPALSRRFQLVKLDEPSVEQTIHILRGLRPLYEEAHKVYITESAIQSAATLSDRYISGRQLPDKAIDVLDTACAKVSTALDMPPRQINSLRNQAHQIISEINILERDNKIGGTIDYLQIEELNSCLGKIKEEESELESAWQMQKRVIDQLIESRRRELDKDDSGVDESGDDAELQADARTPHELLAELYKLQESQSLIHADVDDKQVSAVISDWTGIPLNTINGDELNRLTRLPEHLKASIKGQDEAIEKIHNHLLTAMADLRREGRPMGAFLLVGPSGVGKTETAVQIADYLFGGRQFMTTINMSEYQEKHTLSRLIGSPPGYVGFGEGGILSEAIRQRPYSVVLLDEVEKAHPDVLNLFYQAFDKGEFADGEGRTIDCKNNLFFLTSNIGFDNAVMDYESLTEEVLRIELMKFFKPALLARMQTVRFSFLSDDTMTRIIEFRLEQLSNQFRNRYQAELHLDEGIKDALKTRCVYRENGARMLDAGIEGDMLPPLSLAVLQHLASKKPIKQAKLAVTDEGFSAEVI